MSRAAWEELLEQLCEERWNEALAERFNEAFQAAPYEEDRS